MQELIAEAILGKDAEEFLASELGQYIVGRAEQEEREAMDQLSNVSPWRRNRIRKLQNDIWRARSVRGWLVDMVTAGRIAMQQLEE